MEKEVIVWDSSSKKDIAGRAYTVGSTSTTKWIHVNNKKTNKSFIVRFDEIFEYMFAYMKKGY